MSNATATNEPEKIGVKKLEEYEQSNPEQLDLFYLDQKKEKQYSNSIYLYDAIPKFFHGNQNEIRKDGKYLDPITGHFQYKGREYSVTIHPAKIEIGEGEWKEFLPSQREELVEAALIKLATENNCVFLDDQAGVVFTLYQLQKELQRVGHGYKIAEIKQALEICKKTEIELKRNNGDKNELLSETMFLSLGLSSRSDWKKLGKKAKAFVRLNSLVRESIIKGTFRLFNYEKYMSYKSRLARHLYKRLSYSFTQASWDNKYEIWASTIERESGMKKYSRTRDAIFKIKEAIEALKKDLVLANYEEIKTKKEGKKIIDIKFSFEPHFRFIGETVRANTKNIKADINTSSQKAIKQLAEKKSF